jgi:hypothetical protein
VQKMAVQFTIHQQVIKLLPLQVRLSPLTLHLKMAAESTTQAIYQSESALRSIQTVQERVLQFITLQMQVSQMQHSAAIPVIHTSITVLMVLCQSIPKMLTQ